MIRGITILAVLILFFQQVSNSQSVRFRDLTFKEAMEVAAQEDKDVFIDFYTSWCAPCRWMDKNIFSRSDIGNFMNRSFVSIKVDAEKSFGPELSKDYGVRAFPTYVFTDKRGSEIHRSIGKKELGDFFAIIRQAADPGRRLSNLDSLFNAGHNSTLFLKDYALSLRDAQRSTRKATTRLLRENPTISPTPDNIYFFYVVTDESDHPGFRYLLKNRQQMVDYLGEGISGDFMDKLISFSMNRYLGLKQDSSFTATSKILEELIPEESTFLIGKAFLDFYESQGNWTSYAGRASYLMSRDEINDPQLVRRICWNFFKYVGNKQWLRNASIWSGDIAKRQLNYSDYYVYTAILHKLQIRDQAAYAAETTLKLASGHEVYYSNAQAVLDSIEAGKTPWMAIAQAEVPVDSLVVTIENKPSDSIIAVIEIPPLLDNITPTSLISDSINEAPIDDSLIAVVEESDIKGIRFRKIEWDSVLSLARSEDKQILIMIRAEWSNQSYWMESHVLSDGELIAFYNDNFISVKLDIDEDSDHPALKNKSVRYLPAFLFYNAKGDLIKEIFGSRYIAQFLQIGAEVLKP